jgi:hypothetical protein
MVMPRLENAIKEHGKPASILSYFMIPVEAYYAKKPQLDTIEYPAFMGASS